MRIGEAEKATRVPAKMIRYYESIGLLPLPPRSASSYRIYDDIAISAIRFVRMARDLGFSIPQIQSMLQLLLAHKRLTTAARKSAMDYVGQLDSKLEALEELRSAFLEIAKSKRK